MYFEGKQRFYVKTISKRLSADKKMVLDKEAEVITINIDKKIQQTNLGELK